MSVFPSLSHRDGDKDGISIDPTSACDWGNTARADERQLTVFEDPVGWEGEGEVRGVLSIGKAPKLSEHCDKSQPGRERERRRRKDGG